MNDVEGDINRRVEGMHQETDRQEARHEIGMMDEERADRYRKVFKIAEHVVQDTLVKEARVVDVQKRLGKPGEYVLVGREMRLGLSQAYFTAILIVNEEGMMKDDDKRGWMMWGNYGMDITKAVESLRTRIYR